MMSMPVRASTSHKLKRRRERRLSAGLAKLSSPPEATGPERRDRDPSQDTAVYNCECGMVFEAPVCTSVGCPHCGGHQAW